MESILSYLKSTLGKRLEVRKQTNKHIYVPHAVGGHSESSWDGESLNPTALPKSQVWGPFNSSNVKGQLGSQAEVAIKAHKWQRLSSWPKERRVRLLWAQFYQVCLTLAPPLLDSHNPPSTRILLSQFSKSPPTLTSDHPHIWPNSSSRPDVPSHACLRQEFPAPVSPLSNVPSTTPPSACWP